jgi:hypothetical protein
MTSDIKYRNNLIYGFLALKASEIQHGLNYLLRKEKRHTNNKKIQRIQVTGVTAISY